MALARGSGQRLTETQGDVRIRSNEVIYDWEAVLDTVLEQDAVIGASPYTEGVIMLQHQNRPLFPLCVALSLGRRKRSFP